MGHEETSAPVKAAVKELGLVSVPVDLSAVANRVNAMRLLPPFRLLAYGFAEISTGDS